MAPTFPTGRASYVEMLSPRDHEAAVTMHPIESCNRISFALMLWMDGLIRRGATTPLQEHDVWLLPSDDTAAALSARFSAEWAIEKTRPTPRFHKALWRTMRRRLWCTLGLYLLYSFIMLLQPIVIKSLLQYMQGKPTALGIESGYGLAALLTVVSLIAVTVIDFGQLLASNLGCNAKTIIMDVVYQKSLKLSGFAKRGMSSGAIVTLSGVDSERLFDGFLIGPWSPTAPISIAAIFVMIGLELGYVVGLVGCVFMYLILFLGYLSAKTVGETRRALLNVQSERVKLTNEVLQGIRVVKMYGWERDLEAAIDAIRAQELVFLKQYHRRRVFNTAALSVAPVICLALCLLLYVAQGNALSPDIAFTVLAYMNVARLPCYNFSNGSLFVQEALTSCDRVGTYLLADEVVESATTDADQVPKVAITDGDFTWHASPSTDADPSLPLTLRNIHLHLAPASLTIVVGAVGSGKSSLVSALLGEIHQVRGTCHVTGNVAALDVHVAGAVFRDCVQGLLASKTTLLVLNSHYHLLPHADRVVVLVDGAIAADGPFDVVKAQFPDLQSSAEGEAVTKTDAGQVVAATGTKTPSGLVEDEERAAGGVSSTTYLAYLGSSGWSSSATVVAIAILFGITQGLVTLGDWFMGYWSTHDGHLSQLCFASLFVAMAFGSLGIIWGRSLFLLVLSLRSSKALHASLLTKVLSAPVNTVFDVTPVGRILNRFSSDLDQVDSQLPLFALFLLQTLAQVLAVVVVCAASLPFILVVYLPIAAVFFWIQRLYVTPSCDLKRMDATTRSPVLNVLSETIHGLSTIRAFRMSSEFAAKSRAVIADNNRFFFAYRMLARWLAMRLDWVSCLVVAAVAFLLIACKDAVGPVAAGLALTYASQMTSGLSALTGVYALVDNIMTSVERLEEYNSLETEGDTRVVTTTVDASWPTQGVVTFDHYAMRYRDHLDLVLKDVSFTVPAGAKVGICGRTGSGKSSLMVALFRMVEAASGRILIDGVDLASIDLHTMRSRLTIIPQDPVLFSGSLRFNLDPSNGSSDDELWSVLKQVHLGDTISTLEFEVAEKGGNLSVGQRQLLCIARALLRKSRVVLLDEATASIDLASDRLIQETIKECFGHDVTLLVIAHRLDTILDSDQILVMADGRVAEYGPPSELLANEASAFAQLAKQTQQ
ncbi:hypothetical protein SPRG_20050 [Saprolegnia parasitica CBS 223.65]|uniref:ATP-binding Cassette (ABC) Superfamily n=1 Tax=Saprolegnia parasitica (strain CBS 223.65) TaxID=695850 RepID=A0A067CEW9_SAPPC|nr:hypothetical protein SPRG_20050 [Saprolegnia parasitica CBS 223.65]KDO29294.1 hypothetical protein SPRG_20050 [Saprolegnia parasitica CBS 223.65]|eukprot:XP_012200001.1 hypothetical protein SPRG_20050 [Saprolegnia parasitica CBS 223.65]